MWSLRGWCIASLCLLPGTLVQCVSGSNLLVSHFSGSIYSLSLTTDNGKAQLAITSTVRAGGRMPSWLTLDSATGSLYVVDEAAEGGPMLSTIKVHNDSSLQLVNTLPTSGSGVHSSLYGGSNGKGFLAVPEYDFSTITTYKLPLSPGSQVQKLAFNLSSPGAVPSRQERPHPHAVFTDPSGRFLLSADLGADLIRIFSIDAPSGRLTACPAAAAGPGDGPRHGAFWTAPGGNSSTLYTVNELGRSVTAWAVSKPAGPGGCLGLRRLQTISTYPEGHTPPPPGQPAAEVHVAGDFVYATNRNDQSFGSGQDSVATYAVDPRTGLLTLVELANTYAYFPRTFAVNRAGDAVAFGGQTSSTVTVVARDVTTGRLGELLAQLQVGPPGTVNTEDGLSSVVWNE